MNSPVVIEQAKKLVALDEFEMRTNDTARIEFLYERIYQRLLRNRRRRSWADFAQIPLTEKPAEVKSTLTEAQRLPVPRKCQQARLERQLEQSSCHNDDKETRAAHRLAGIRARLAA